MQLTEEEQAAEAEKLRRLSPAIRVYEFTGPLFFGAAGLIDQVIVKEMTKCLILRMRGVPSLDSTAMNALFTLCEKCRKKGTVLILSHVNEQPMRAMQKAGFVELAGRENFCPGIDAAIARAEELVKG